MADTPVREGLKAAADTAKEIIALASGIIVLTVTFAEKFKPAEMNVLAVPWSLKVAWVIYGATVFFGVWTLLAITGSLGNPDHPNAKQGLMGPNVRIPSFAMIVCFVSALGLTIAAGFSIVQ